MIRLVLFDIDGTLIYTSGAGQKAFASVFASCFGVANGTANLKFAGRTDPGIIRDFFLEHRIEPSHENYRRFFEVYPFYLEHHLTRLPGGTQPGVPEALRCLAELPHHPVIGLLTGNVRLGAEIKLRHFGLWDHFAIGGFADDHIERNEIARVARRRGELAYGSALAGEEILVIGDTPLDIECGRAIGAKVLAVATGGARLGELQQHAPDWAVPDLRAVDLRAICLQESPNVATQANVGPPSPA